MPEDPDDQMDKQTMKAYKRGVISWQEACRKEADRQIKLGNKELSNHFWEESKEPEPVADEDNIPPHELYDMLN